MTDEKRKKIEDAWSEVQAIIKEDYVRKPPYHPVGMSELIPDALERLKRKQGVWEKYGLHDDPDLEEWFQENDFYSDSRNFPL